MIRNRPRPREPEIRMMERAICLACGWRSANVYPIGSSRADDELDRHKCSNQFKAKIRETKEPEK